MVRQFILLAVYGLLMSGAPCVGQENGPPIYRASILGGFFKGIGRVTAVRDQIITDSRRFDGGFYGATLLVDRAINAGKDEPEIRVGLFAGVQALQLERTNILGMVGGQLSIQLHPSPWFNRLHVASGSSFGTIELSSEQRAGLTFTSGITMYSNAHWMLLAEYHAVRARSYLNRIGQNNQVLYRTELSSRFSSIGVRVAYCL
jgi:hypothetical protein